MNDKMKCMYCDGPMKMWQTPSFGFAGSTGFGYPYLWVCFNNECPFYVNGWQHTQKTFGRKASYRFATYPDNDCNIAIPVFTEKAGKGNIIEDPAEFHEQEDVSNAKRELYALKTSGNVDYMMNFICNEDNPPVIRIEAAEFLGDTIGLNDLEKLYACSAKQRDVVSAVIFAIKNVHNRHFTRDCPFCAEIIKQRAKVCRYCKREIKDAKFES